MNLPANLPSISLAMLPARYEAAKAALEKSFSMPLNADLRQRLNTRAAAINKSVNDCVEEAVEQWLEVTEDDPRAGTATVAPEATAPV